MTSVGKLGWFTSCQEEKGGTSSNRNSGKKAPPFRKKKTRAVGHGGRKLKPS